MYGILDMVSTIRIRKVVKEFGKDKKEEEVKDAEIIEDKTKDIKQLKERTEKKAKETEE